MSTISGNSGNEKADSARVSSNCASGCAGLVCYRRCAVRREQDTGEQSREGSGRCELSDKRGVRPVSHNVVLKISTDQCNDEEEWVVDER